MAPPALPTQAAAAEITDLVAALKKAKVPDEELERIRSAHEAARAKLSKFLADADAWHNSRLWVYDEKGARRGKPHCRNPGSRTLKSRPGCRASLRTTSKARWPGTTPP